MSIETALPLLMFLTLFGLILCGYPVAFTIAGTGLLFAFIGEQLDLFNWMILGNTPSKVFNFVQQPMLIAVPLFILMGLLFEKSGLAKELLEAMQQCLRKVRGGLAISVVFVGTLLAATTGIVGATVVMMGALSLPTMLKWGYQKELAVGTIAASGTLGQIIPPSIVLVILASMLNVDVGDMFFGSVLPGLILVLFYLIYITIRVYLNPSLAPAPEDLVSKEESQEVLSSLFITLLPCFTLIFLVLGSILLGIASPFEASSCGAVGAIALTLFKRKFSWSMLKSSLNQTVLMTSMVFFILVGAQVFGLVFRGLQGEDIIIETLQEINLSKTHFLILIMVLLFVLGFFLDFIEICFIVLPIVTPILVKTYDFTQSDCLWLGVLVAINLQTSFLTPPFGFSLFYLKGVAPKEVKTLHLYKGILPFVGIQILTLLLIAFFPDIVHWLPEYKYGSGS